MKVRYCPLCGCNLLPKHKGSMCASCEKSTKSIAAHIRRSIKKARSRLDKAIHDIEIQAIADFKGGD